MGRERVIKVDTDDLGRLGIVSESIIDRKMKGNVIVKRDLFPYSRQGALFIMGFVFGPGLIISMIIIGIYYEFFWLLILFIPIYIFGFTYILRGMPDSRIVIYENGIDLAIFPPWYKYKKKAINDGLITFVPFNEIELIERIKKNKSTKSIVIFHKNGNGVIFSSNTQGKMILLKIIKACANKKISIKNIAYQTDKEWKRLVDRDTISTHLFNKT